MNQTDFCPFSQSKGKQSQRKYSFEIISNKLILIILNNNKNIIIMILIIIIEELMIIIPFKSTSLCVDWTSSRGGIYCTQVRKSSVLTELPVWILTPDCNFHLRLSERLTLLWEPPSTSQYHSSVMSEGASRRPSIGAPWLPITLASRMVLRPMVGGIPVSQTGLNWRKSNPLRSRYGFSFLVKLHRIWLY